MISGYYKLEITGKNPRRFLRELIKKKYVFFSIEYNKENIVINCNKKTYQKIMKIKTIYKVKLVGLGGVAKFFYMIKNNLIFLSCFVFGLILINFLSRIIFEIEVIHTDKLLQEFLISELKEYGIGEYQFKVSYQEKEEIISNLLNDYPEKLEWLEITEIGNKYIVRVEERKLEEDELILEPRDIVAEKDGMIISVEAVNGVVLKEKYDYVKKGEVIISGAIKNKDELQTVVSATGVVMAETWYQVEVELPLLYHEEYLTGEEKSVWQFQFLSANLDLFDFSKYEYKAEDVMFSLGNELFLFSLRLVNQKEKRVVDYCYTLEEGVKAATSLAKEKLLVEIGANSEIIYQKALKTSQKNSKIIVEVFFKVKEDITSYQAISESLEID